MKRPVPVWIIIAAVVVLGVAAALFVAAGGVNVEADAPDGPVVERLLHFTFKRSEATHASNLTPPADLQDPTRVQLAAQQFEMECANCHGRPGFGQSVIPLSMNPRPQYLPNVVGQFTDAQLFEIVEHGVKYSAMPSWPTPRDDEVWSMVAFLRRLPRMDAKTYLAMTALPKTSAGSGAAAGDSFALRPADPWRDHAPKDEFSYAAPSYGFSDQTMLQTPTATCGRCHGADGSGSATGGEAPNLTLQDGGYLQASLQAYTRGSRKSGFMQDIAAQLTTAQITALSQYYAGLPAKTLASAPADPALVKQGERIATEGIPTRAMPACADCHESDGAKVVGAPHIAGQSAVYLRRVLGAMRLGDRGSTVGWNPMPAEAHRLDEHDIAAVAAYYASLTPAKGAASQGAMTPAPAASSSASLAHAKSIFETECLKCHTNGGRGDRAGGFPDLTLQTAPYVAQTLHALRTRQRPNAQMRDVIDSLTFDDMTSLANYVNSLKPQPALLRPDRAAALRGAAIAMHGVPARGIPACLSCHGADGVAALPLIPRLQGQSPLYLRNRLNNFAKPYHVDLSALNPMPGIASRLTDQERADLAAYFAAAPPLDKSAARPTAAHPQS